jgi:hypothetical protein
MATPRSVTIHASADEARWLLTALGVMTRLLDSTVLETAEGERYRDQGRSTLQALALQLPPWVEPHYLPPHSPGQPSLN